VAAAETAAEAVTVEPSSSTQALLSAEQVATDAPAIETTSPASMPETTINETADVSASSAVTTESAQVSETQTAPSTNFSKPVIQPAAEAAPESAPVTTGVAIETVEKVVEEPTATITDTTEVSAEVESAASEAVTENITSPASNEVTAEDLNALVLRQATSADEQATVTTSNTTASLSGVSIHATSRSWVEVRDPSNGKILFTGVMSIGSTFDLPDTEGLLLDTGNAGALDITVKGVSVPNIGDIGDVRKSVSLDAERLKAGTATNR